MKETKNLSIGLVLLAIGMCFTSFKKPMERARKRNLDIFLFIGQSNMAGVAPIGSLDTVTLKNVYLFNESEQWEPAKNTEKEGLNRYSTAAKKSNQKLNPGYSFSRKIAAYTQREIGVVSNARGGTTVLWWQKGYTGENDFNLYEEAIARAKAALASSPGSRIKGIIWHQGEGDNSKPSCTLYMGRLKKLVEDLRTDLGDQKIPFIAGEVGKWNSRGLGVNPVIRQIKENIPHSDWVSSDGLTSINLEKNDPHFDTFSQRVFGERYADKALELIYKMSPGVVTLFTEASFNGRSIVLRPGEYSSRDLESLGIGDKEITSLKIARRTTVLLFPGDFSTAPHSVSKDQKDLGAQGFSSIRILK